MDEPTPQPFANQTLPEGEKQAFPASSMPLPSKPSVVGFERGISATSVTDRIPESAWGAVERGCDRASVLYDRMQSRAAVIRRKTDEALRKARQQGRHLANEYPVQVIAGIAGVAFVSGMLLRFWRSSRYD